ncbi:MAG TPA: hypothetical protein VGL88_06990 [Pseudonocardiaceae bacterium]
MGRRRYHPHHRPYHHPYHHRHHGQFPRRALIRWNVARLLVLLCLAVVAGMGAVAVTLLTVLALGQVILLGTGAFVVLRHLRRRHHRAVDHREPASVPPARSAREQAAPDWRATRARFAQLRSEYGQFECDPLEVLRLPALVDVTVPSTARFVDAFAEAQALDTDSEPSQAHCVRFATAVDRARRAWNAARDAAERIRLAGIPAEERATVQRAIKLLTMARDSDHDAERTAAYAKARTELAKLERTGTLRLPPAAAAALDNAARGQLPAGKAAV